VPYDPAAAAPRWQAFLERVLPDEELRLYLQRLAGYALTGSTAEQRLTFFLGAGANGKSTLVNVLLSIIGDDYAQQAPPTTFLERRPDGIPNDVARLRGARLVVVTETNEGRRLNESLVKAMTGGDRLVARFMRGEFFEFQPEFTPILVTNHLPNVRGTDHALWRRIDVVPFTVTIPEEEWDRELADALRTEEATGILAWAVAGCASWREHGLARPEAVIRATSGYRDEQDALAAFINESCVSGPRHHVAAGLLYARYATWAKDNGLEPITQQSFGRKLTEKGFRTGKRTAGKRFWLGIAVSKPSGRPEP
jgi:putative DNA primase/helicase